MTDNLSSEVRRKNMSHIRSKNSRPEELVRKALFKRGFRYRKNVRNIMGCPDIVLSKYKTIIFVNGCFWHMHTECGRFHWPASNEEYWRLKISRNVERDQLVQSKLREDGWNVIIVWECQLKKRLLEDTINRLVRDITGK